MTSPSSSPSDPSWHSLVAQFSRGYFGWPAGTVLGVGAGVVAEGALRTAPINWAVGTVGVCLAVSGVSVVLVRLLWVALLRRMRQHFSGASDRRSFRPQILESFRSPAVVDVLKAAGTSALVVIALVPAEFDLPQVSVLVPVRSLLATLGATLLILETWLDPELSIPLRWPRRRVAR